MKRIVCIVCLLALLLTMAACGKKADKFYPKPEDVTMESIKERTIPQVMLGFEGGFQIEWRNEDIVNAGAYASTTSMSYRYDGEKVLVSQTVDYDNNGEYTHIYFDTNPIEDVMFIDDDRNEEITVSPLTDRDVQNSLAQSLFGLDYYECEITECTKGSDGLYRLGYDAKDPSLEDRVVQHVDMDIDPVRGSVNSAVIYYYDYGEPAGSTDVTVTYNRAIRIDDSPRTIAIEQGLYDPEQAAAEPVEETPTGSFNFAATDLDGKLRTFNEFAGAQLVVVSFWEPESPACVEALGELEKLYGDYGDSLVVLGVHSSDDEDAVRAAVKEAGATFPILRCDTRLAIYQPDTLPAVLLVDGQGELVSEEPYFGVLAYNDLVTLIGTYME